MIIHAGPGGQGRAFSSSAGFPLCRGRSFFMKWRLFRTSPRENGYFLEMFWDNKAFHRTLQTTRKPGCKPRAQLFRAAYTEMQRLGKNSKPRHNQERRAHLSMVDVVEKDAQENNDRPGQQAGEGHFFSCDQGNTTHSRTLRDRVGDYGGLQGHWNERGGQPGRGWRREFSKAPHCHGRRFLPQPFRPWWLQLLQQQGDKLSG